MCHAYRTDGNRTTLTVLEKGRGRSIQEAWKGERKPPLKSMRRKNVVPGETAGASSVTN